ncbi:ABC transporter permease [Oceanicaulis alexandrii]|uniref:ABC transporter permease n=1 Tax=Oceanicaulis alexandrii TaxID=153233 RepID=UPI0035CEA3DD
MANAYLAEIKAEVLKLSRMPEFAIPTLILPVMFFTLFGVIIPGSRDNAPYLLSTFGVFAVMGPALFGFGAGVAQERERGWLTLKRAVPAPASALLVAKTTATILIASVSLAAIYAVAAFAADVSLPPAVWLGLLLVHVLSAIPFVLIGLALGFVFGANAAVAVANILYLGMAVLGGLWMPISIFPRIMGQIAQVLPSFHLAEIALAISGAAGDKAMLGHILATLVITVIAAGLALLAWARQR